MVSAAPLTPGDFTTLFTRLIGRVESRLIGKAQQIRLAITCLLAGGHLLLDDVPGVGKTSLAKGVRDAIADATTTRVQGSPDLLPSDIVGTTVLGKDRDGDPFEFLPGPVFANVVLFDEINRAAPRTQSALLEAMAERSVTVRGRSITLPAPFFVLATQNPVESAGTYPMPEAQLDRFAMRLSLGYPSAKDEAEILKRFGAREVTFASTAAPVAMADLEAMSCYAERQVTVLDNMYDYLVRVVRKTREHPDTVRLGASPRGTVALLRASRVLAAAAGDDAVTPDHVREVATHVLAHRLVWRGAPGGGAVNPQEAAHEQREFVARVVDKVDTPRRR